MMLALSAGCEGENRLGWSCGSAESCGGLECEPVARVCTQTCTDDADCVTPDGSGDQVCGVLSDGRRGCLSACESFGYEESTTCVDGVPTACPQAPATSCLDCGCPDGRRCDPAVGCVDLSDVGGPCRRDEDCRTLNCSENRPWADEAGVCYVPLLAPCERNNCELCQRDGDFSFCSRSCSGDNTCNGGICVGTVGWDDVVRNSSCRPRCNTPQCAGGSCEPLRSGGTFCDCPNGCSTTTPQQPVGGECNEPSDCISGRCYNTPRFITGYCTAECTGTPDCGAGASCVNVACVGAEDTSCGSLCLPSCDLADPNSCEEGACRQISAADGGAAPVCDVRSPENGPCSGDADCQAGRCAGGLCTTRPGTPSGGTCTDTAECRAGVCNGGVCVGTALLGDPCELNADCSVGRCCETGPSAGTCASSC